MSNRHDTNSSAMLSNAEEVRLQLVGYLSSTMSLIGTLYVLIHFGYMRWCSLGRLKLSHEQHMQLLYERSRIDFMDKLVVVLALFDLVTIVTRAVGRSVMHILALCRVQAAFIQAGNLASCIWVCCMAYNLYRWIAGGESETTRQRRFPWFVAVAIVPGASFVIYHLRANMYGDATFYCWLGEIRYMFSNFYLFYLLMIIFNLVLLALIHINMKKRVARQDTVEADTSSMLIRRKLLLYIVVFIGHRTPMMIYRIFEASGIVSINAGLFMQVIQDLNGFSNSIVYGGICRRSIQEVPPSRDESISSPTESVMDKADKKRIAIAETDPEFESCLPERIGNAIQSDREISPESSSAHLATFQSHIVHDGQSHTYCTWQQRLQKRFSTNHSPSPARKEQPKIAIFASTFNMGEKDVNERELVLLKFREWIPLGQDVYVIGVQECMDVADLQSKILRHLVSGSSGKYMHFKREIGRRATALGYHGYIALCLFVRATAITSGRFRMPYRQRCNKTTQEVFRGKSLLLFGRASNKGAVGLSFRFDDTSFAFVTCHLASDSSRLKRCKQMKISRAGKKASDKSVDLSESSNIARDSDGDIKPSASDDLVEDADLPPSKVKRRNQDAMEILQQLYLDEEDYGFGFSHLHHHSIILGDFNYRMTCKCVTPKDMLQLLLHAGTDQNVRADNHTIDLAPPISLQRSTNELSSHIDICDFRQCITPKEQSGQRNTFTRRCYRDGKVGNRRMSSNSDEINTVIPPLLRTLVEEHDELYQLCRSQQIFHGFQENEITFFPTFRRIRGKTLRGPLDAASFQQNYSLVATHGGYRVPSYTDRVLYSSLDGVRDSLQCLSYNSCEAVTSSDHKPVSACFEVKLLSSFKRATSEFLLAEDYLWNAILTENNPLIVCLNRTFSGARMKDVPGACELRLRVEFQSIHWVHIVDATHFDRADQVEVGFLFPLPCEDVFAHQRKLHEVAGHLTFGGNKSGKYRRFGVTSALTPSSNFHTIKWRDFVNDGLRYHTMADAGDKKHVAVVIRSLSRGRTMSRTASASDVSSGCCSPSTKISVHSLASKSALISHKSSGSFLPEKLFGQGLFCIEGRNKKCDVCVPLTVGGRLLGRLQVQVSLQLRQRQ
ncbi:putative endonuclease/exonuclease/phosphatase, GPCR, family 2 [Plasmopara halstedii]